jgi:photosystem II stability/assembly factor-like uncharacterized protein
MFHAKKFVVLAAFFAALYFESRTGAAQTFWEHIFPSRDIVGDAVLVEKPEGAEWLALASRSSVYFTRDGGVHWERVFHLGGREQLIRLIPGKERRCYLVSTQGVFVNDTRGRQWERIFSPPGGEKHSVLSFSVHPRDPEILFTGTSNGLYWSLDRGRSWSREAGPLGREAVTLLVHHPEEECLIFAGTREKLYRSEDAGRTFDPVFRLPAGLGRPAQAAVGGPDSPALQGRTESGEEDREVQDAEDLTDDVAFQEPLGIMKASPVAGERLFLATRRGVFQSSDRGSSWVPLPLSGLPSREIRDLEISPKNGMLFIATPVGIYRYNPSLKAWEPASRSLPDQDVTAIELTAKGKEIFYATTQSGLYRGTAEWIPVPRAVDPEPFDLAPLLDLFLREPGVREVQKAAIRYAGVANAKIRRWHLASRMKALVPELSLGKDLSVASNVDIDRGGTNTADFYIFGPDTRSTRRDLSLDWNLRDLIWSSDQTAIDSRAKQMVELRDEIVTEVTRLYFERRRLVIELYAGGGSTELEPQAYLDLLVRVDEYTAYLDGMTGGYFSEELRKRKIHYAPLSGAPGRR